jgi:hypothetical protein
MERVRIKKKRIYNYDRETVNQGHAMTTNKIKESLRASSRTVVNNLRILVEGKGGLGFGGARSCRYELVKK